MDENLRLWTSVFGDEYIKRNKISDENTLSRRRMFLEMFSGGQIKPSSIVEIGAGVGANLIALRGLLGTSVALTAIEPNEMARGLIEPDVATVLNGCAQEIPLQDAAGELVFTSGVLIHIPPSNLGRAMDEIYRVSARWIAAIEYFDTDLTEIEYRGRRCALWRGDYGSLYLDRFSDLRCIAYGFEWKRKTGLDNVTWWLLEKNP
jgi:pseudaminic acid biosynthesis-associated methylase